MSDYKNRNIYIPQFVSSRSYFIGTPFSKTFVTNELSNFEISLDGHSSDLFYLMLQNKNYDDIFLHFKDLKKEELDNFLFQLEDLGFLKLNSEEVKNLIPAPFKQDKAEECIREEFEQEMEFFFQKNNLISDLFLELTYRCNLKCIHCFQDKSIPNKRELSLFEIKSIIDDFYEKGLYKVTLSGGECTLHNDFLEIIRYIRKKRLQFEFFTNGQTLYDDSDFLELVLSEYPARICLSLYSINEEVHDYITGVKGSCYKTKEIIKKLCARNINVCIKSLQLKSNVGSWREIKKFAQSVGASLKMDTHIIGNKKLSEHCLENSQISEMMLDKDSPFFIGNEVLSSKYNQDNWKKLPICAATRNAFTINPYGEVFACPTLPIILGNIKERTISQIIQGMQVEKIRNYKIEDLKDCYTHSYCKFCSYCMGIAMRENGLLKKAEICCKNAKIREQAYKKYNGV